jgi:hypothetical protein
VKIAVRVEELTHINLEELVMPIRHLDPQALGGDVDWEGNNAALSCPVCKKVFIVSHTQMHVGPNREIGYRKCPSCGKSVGRVGPGGLKSGATASIEWSE